MEKKPLTMQQKKKIFNIGRIVGYALLLLGLAMAGLAAPMTWVGFVVLVAMSVFRVIMFRCPECDELIPARFGVIGKACPKCGWQMDQEETPASGSDN